MVHIAALSLCTLPIALTGCGGSASNGDPQRQVKQPITVELITPSRDTTVVSGATLKISWRATADSCRVFFAGTQVASISETSATIETADAPLGAQRIRVVAWRGGVPGETSRRVTLLANVAPKEFGYNVVNAYPHDENAYTQGLLFHNGFLYESTGQRGASTVRRVELRTGDVLKERKLDPGEFGEGLALHEGALYQLTWTSHKCHKYDLETLTPTGELYYSTQGWGLESDGENLYLTDGTENVYVVNPSTFEVLRTIQAYTNEGPQRMLNELEFIDGLLYANVYLTDLIVALDPKTGAVVRRIHLDGLLPAQERTPHAEVLNGIAYDAARGAIYLTGKYWPKLYHVEFVAK